MVCAPIPRMVDIKKRFSFEKLLRVSPFFPLQFPTPAEIAAVRVAEPAFSSFQQA